MIVDCAVLVAVVFGCVEFVVFVLFLLASDDL